MTTYRNPILPGMYPDPSICRSGDDYYLVTSSFCYFPGVPIFHSRDLVHWRQIGHCLTRRSQLDLSGIPSHQGIYAPTIRCSIGRFYMVTTLVGGRGNFFVWTDDPGGEWSDPVWLEQDGIDPSLLFDDDGRVYLTSTGNPPGLYQSEIDLATGRSLNEPRFIWRGTGGRYPEGPHLYHIGDDYYLMISEGGTEYAHRITLARANSPWGEFEPCPHNPIFTHMDQPELPLQATGHGDLVQDQGGNWWMVCLAIRPTERYFPTHHLGRETILLPVGFDGSGWLMVNDGKPAALQMETHTLPLTTVENLSDHDDFDSLLLDFRWNFIRTQDEACYSLSERPGWLRLRGNGYSLNDMASPAFIGRRQQHFACVVSALLDYEPLNPDDEAGLTVYQNEDHHYEVAIMRDETGRSVVVRQRIGVLAAIVVKESLPNGATTLVIEATALEYTFAYIGMDGSRHVLAVARTRYLSSEVAGGFTGVFIGMYATGSTPADFDFFDYQVVTLTHRW